jgi:hypothetical protein
MGGHAKRSGIWGGKMGIRFELEYFTDVWHDDDVKKRAVYESRDGEIISLSNIIRHFAYLSATFCILKVNGEIDSRWQRDAETYRWKLTEN